MATTLKRLGQAPIPDSGTTTVYTVPSSTKAQITKIVVNVVSGGTTCRVYDVKNSASAGNEVNVIKSIATTADTAYEFGVGIILDTAGDTIQIVTTGNWQGAITVYGIEVS